MTTLFIRRYILCVAAKSAHGIGVPEYYSTHTALSGFLCAKHGYAQIMVGCVRASSGAPGLSSRLRQPCTVHHQSIGVVGGDG
ncbi:hypothetical protein [Escherichia coli]|uniref:hypothetical protein n=1 Tax=Escherichia coli TaxID=562 RepID=UPI001C402F89|nr:hypothetical protein [Escherichia coli]